MQYVNVFYINLKKNLKYIVNHLLQPKYSVTPMLSNVIIIRNVHVIQL